MKIYFSCSITGGRRDEVIYAHMVQALQLWGHEVLTAHLSHSEVMALEATSEPRDVYQRDVAWVEECDVLIAEVSTPSHGVGYEIALGLLLGKPVLCCHQAGRAVSKMITGNTHANLRVAAYTLPDEALGEMRRFLEALNLQEQSVRE